MVILHEYRRSSSAYRVRIALALLGIPAQQRPVDLLAGDQTGPENLARNPQGLVPTLEIDGHSLTQSLDDLPRIATIDQRLNNLAAFQDAAPVPPA